MSLTPTVLTSDLPVLRIPGKLTPALLEMAARPVDVVIDDTTRKRVDACHTFMLDCVTGGQAVYGATTGFGPLVTFPGREDMADQCDNVLDHLTAGQGPELEPALARATVLARLWSLAQ